MSDSWFIVPILEEPTPGQPDSVDRKPAYISDLGIEVVSGSVFTFEQGARKGEDVYVLHVYAESAVLDDLAAKQDVYSIWGGDASEQDVTQYLNKRFDRTWTFAEWAEVFSGTQF